jgi:WD40 repeat protein
MVNYSRQLMHLVVLQRRSFASAGFDKKISIWNKDGKLLYTLVGHKREIRGLAFNAEGNRLASASADGMIGFWGARNDLLMMLKGHQNAVWSVSFSPDGEKLISASRDRTVKIWSIHGMLDAKKLRSTGCSWITDYSQQSGDVEQASHYLCDAPE